MLEFKQDNCGRTDRHQRTMSDHNSSLSTLCSGELKTGDVTESDLLHPHPPPPPRQRFDRNVQFAKKKIKLRLAKLQ